MKKLLLLATSLLVAVGAYAQGTVNFANGGAGVNAPVTNGTTGTMAAPANGTFYAMLYVGASGTASADLSTNGFGGGAALIGSPTAGYFFGGTRTISTFAPGAAITAQVRVWSSAAGATWESIAGADSTIRSGAGYATSPTFNVTLGGNGIPNPNLVGMGPGFIVGPVVPEPSAIALGLLGLGAVALIRRRK
jgi:MYXO-CTERM domain-containing protein